MGLRPEGPSSTSSKRHDAADRPLLRQAVDCWESLGPIRGKIEIAGDDSGGLVAALGDEIVKIFVGRRAQRFESEVIDNEQSNACQRGELTFVGTGSGSSVEAGSKLHARSEQHFDALTDRAVAGRLS